MCKPEIASRCARPESRMAAVTSFGIAPRSPVRLVRGNEIKGVFRKSPPYPVIRRQCVTDEMENWQALGDVLNGIVNRLIEIRAQRARLFIEDRRDG